MKRSITTILAIWLTSLSLANLADDFESYSSAINAIDDALRNAPIAQVEELITKKKELTIDNKETISSVMGERIYYRDLFFTEYQFYIANLVLRNEESAHSHLTEARRYFESAYVIEPSAYSNTEIRELMSSCFYRSSSHFSQLWQWHTIENKDEKDPFTHATFRLDKKTGKLEIVD